MNFKVTVPPTMEQGSYSTIVSTGGRFGRESIAQKALWDYNSARDHDGLSPLKKMPKGTKYHPMRN
jgi:hypothetical protein